MVKRASGHCSEPFLQLAGGPLVRVIDTYLRSSLAALCVPKPLAKQLHALLDRLEQFSGRYQRLGHRKLEFAEAGLKLAEDRPGWHRPCAAGQLAQVRCTHGYLGCYSAKRCPGTTQCTGKFFAS